MKTVLVAQNSSYTHTNAAVRILANMLNGAGHDAIVVETTISERGGVSSLCERLYREKADIYAFSVYIWNRSEQLCAASLIKKLLPSCTVVLGGPEVSYETEDFLYKNPFVDHVIRGEGEKAIVDIADGKCQRGFVDGGIFEGFTDSHEPYFSCGKSYGDTDGKLIYYETSRGCPFSCSYCLSSVKSAGCAVRAKPTELVKSELSMLMRKNVKVIKLVDRTFNYDRKRAYTLFSHMIAESAFLLDEKGCYVGATVHFEICASLLDEKTLTLLEKAPKGLFRFEIGVQTTNPKSLNAIGRADDTEIILKNVDILREKTNIELHLDLICGLPCDTFGDVRESFNAVYGRCDKLQMGFLKLLSGTRMKAEAQKYGMVSLDVPPYTVLCTKDISFEEMMTLRRISDIAEKLSDKESGFETAVAFIVKESVSPFDMYLALSEYLNNKGNISSKRLYAEIFGFACKHLSLTEDKKEELKERLRFDYLMSNQGRPPCEIERGYTDEEAEYLSEMRKKAIHERDREKDDFFIPALEAHLFCFDTENVYIIDRKNRTYFTIKRY